MKMALFLSGINLVTVLPQSRLGNSPTNIRKFPFESPLDGKIPPTPTFPKQCLWIIHKLKRIIHHY